MSFGHSQKRSEEHTSELQSRQYLVCRLLLEKRRTFYTLGDGPSKRGHTITIRHFPPLSFSTQPRLFHSPRPSISVRSVPTIAFFFLFLGAPPATPPFPQPSSSLP